METTTKENGEKGEVKKSLETNQKNEKNGHEDRPDASPGANGNAVDGGPQGTM